MAEGSGCNPDVSGFDSHRRLQMPDRIIGSPPDFGSGSRGSSPCLATKTPVVQLESTRHYGCRDLGSTPGGGAKDKRCQNSGSINDGGQR